MSGASRKDVEERQRLHTLVQLQAQEIEALKAEITILSRKGGKNWKFNSLTRHFYKYLFVKKTIRSYFATDSTSNFTATSKCLEPITQT